ncbi:uncharacterized protein LOC110769668 [Prunus avium]|uniref:Uncharacterized protein LOC110769668 n=1 Tax=Prunus avium TaxID=42229 RepID=A0A6P5TQI0_PRUAV|nr:uncharacterized protein LOC110769668 [Prunus avium]
MGKNSRQKWTQKQSKHSSNDAALDHSDSEEEIDIVDEEVSEVKTKKSRNGKEESSVRVSKDSRPGEKRRPRERGNGVEYSAEVEHTASKRRRDSEKKDGKEKVPEVRGGTEDTEMLLKHEVRNPELKKELEKHIRRSRDGSVEKGKYKDYVRDDNEDSAEVEYIASKRRKDIKRIRKDVKEKVPEVGQGMDDTERYLKDEVRNPELKEELEKQIRRNRDGSVDKAKYKDYVRDDNDSRRSSTGKHAKDRRYMDDENYKDKYGEDADRSYKVKHGEDGDRSYKVKQGEDGDRSYKVEYGEDGDRSYRVKHGEDAERSYKDKYGEDGARIYKVKYGEDGDRSYKYGEDGDRSYKDKDGEDVGRSYKVKHEESGDRSYKDKDGEDADRSYKVKHGEDGGDRSYKDKYGEEGDRSYKVKYGKDGGRSYKDGYGEDADRDRRHRDSKPKEDVDWKKTHWEDRHKDEHALIDHNGDRSGTKYTRDKSNAGGIRYKKSRFDSRNYDDGQNTRYSDDRGKRDDDKEDQIYSRCLSTREHADAEKKITGRGMVKSVDDKEDSHKCCVDADFNASHKRQISFPSSYSHVAKDQSRHSREAELMSGDSEPQERVRHGLHFKEVADVCGVLKQSSLSKPTKRLIDKDDSHLGDLSAERCLNPDARASAVHLVDDSKFTTLGIKGSFDSKEFGKRSGVTKDRDSSGTEGKGNLQPPSETPPTGELSREDIDGFSSLSSVKADQLPSNSWSNFPPPRHRYKRNNSSFVGRMYGNARNGAPVNARSAVPNRPSPVMNSFTHFRHGPPPVGLHPVMHQFSALPMYGVRPVMDIRSLFPHHIHDADRFLRQDHSLGWQNPIDGSQPPPLYAWDEINSVAQTNSLAYGRLDWNHNREPIDGQRLETRTDMWKGPHDGVNPELPSVLQAKDPAVRTQEDEIWLGASSLQVQNEENQCDDLVDKSQKIEIGQNSDALAKEPPKPSNSIAEQLPELSKISKDDDDRLWLVYLSKLDISAELTHPELYNQCLKLMDGEQSQNVDEDSLKLLYLEEVVKTQVELSKLASSASLFVAINDCVFQRAMSFYKQQKEETRVMPLPSLFNKQKASFCSAKNMDFVPNSAREKQTEPISSSNGSKPEQLLPTCSAPYKKVYEFVSVVGLDASNGCINDNCPTIDHASQSAPGSPGHLSRAGDSRGGEHSAGSADDWMLVDTRCDHIPFSKVPDEGVMGHSIGSGSVNVSRIHAAFESTH